MPAVTIPSKLSESKVDRYKHSYNTNLDIPFSNEYTFHKKGCLLQKSPTSVQGHCLIDTHIATSPMLLAANAQIAMNDKCTRKANNTLIGLFSCLKFDEVHRVHPDQVNQHEANNTLIGLFPCPADAEFACPHRANNGVKCL